MRAVPWAEKEPPPKPQRPCRTIRIRLIQLDASAKQAGSRPASGGGLNPSPCPGSAARQQFGRSRLQPLRGPRSLEPLGRTRVGAVALRSRWVRERELPLKSSVRLMFDNAGGIRLCYRSWSRAPRRRRRCLPRLAWYALTTTCPDVMTSRMPTSLLANSRICFCIRSNA